MCGQTATASRSSTGYKQETSMAQDAGKIEPKPPVETLLKPPSALARYSCASILVAIFAVWGKFAFVEESTAPGVGSEMHSISFPLGMAVIYLLSIPVLRYFVENYISKTVDMKALLLESMVLYNVGQVILNAWMVYRFVDALLFRGHPFIGDIATVNSGATFAVWIHYCDKYLEFLDTYFMVLRGKMDQVSLLHIYHHTSIALAWWVGMLWWPGGDAYFGAMLNSWIHVMMYSYYALSLLKIPCPWKRYLTQAQLLQFMTVLTYSVVSWFSIPEDAKWTHYGCLIVQSGEMISLFVLFLHFYRKAYSKKKSKQRGPNASLSSSEPAEQSSLSSDSSEDGETTSKS